MCPCVFHLLLDVIEAAQPVPSAPVAPQSRSTLSLQSSSAIDAHPPQLPAAEKIHHCKRGQSIPGWWPGHTAAGDKQLPQPLSSPPMLQPDVSPKSVTHARQPSLLPLLLIDFLHIHSWQCESQAWTQRLSHDSPIFTGENLSAFKQPCFTHHSLRNKTQILSFNSAPASHFISKPSQHLWACTSLTSSPSHARQHCSLTFPPLEHLRYAFVAPAVWFMARTYLRESKKVWAAAERWHAGVSSLGLPGSRSQPLTRSSLGAQRFVASPRSSPVQPDQNFSQLGLSWVRVRRSELRSVDTLAGLSALTSSRRPSSAFLRDNCASAEAAAAAAAGGGGWTSEGDGM